MSDARLTKLTADLLVAMRDQTDHLIGRGLVDKEQLRVTLAPAARKAKVAELHEQGLSQRQIAAVVGVDHATISRDLAGASAPESGASAPLEIPLEDGLMSSAMPRFRPLSSKRTAGINLRRSFT